MKDKEIDQIVLNYLKKKGYRKAESVFREEAQVDSLPRVAHSLELESSASVANYIMFYNADESTTESYEVSYASLRDWIYSSLDLYRVRILLLLFASLWVVSDILLW